VGERVRVWGTKHIGEVLSVRSANQVLGMMKEVVAMRFGPDCQATYGPHWRGIFYQADIMIQNRFRTVEPRDIEAVLPPD
jgi:hypothetical protein